MNWFDTAAYAADAGGGPENAALINILMLVGFIAIFYFLIFRPQNKRRKEHVSLMSSLDKGNEVVSAGGMVGEITKVEEDFVKLRVAEGVEFRMQKSSIVATLPKGTLKGLDS